MILVNDYERLQDLAPPIFSEYLKLKKSSSEEAFLMKTAISTLNGFLNKEYSSWNLEARISEHLSSTDEHIVEDFKTWCFIS